MSTSGCMYLHVCNGLQVGETFDTVSILERECVAQDCSFAKPLLEYLERTTPAKFTTFRLTVCPHVLLC